MQTALRDTKKSLSITLHSSFASQIRHLAPILFILGLSLQWSASAAPRAPRRAAGETAAIQTSTNVHLRNSRRSAALATSTESAGGATSARTPASADRGVVAQSCGAKATWMSGLELNLPNIQFTSVPDDAHAPVIAAINTARSSILMEIYHLSDPDVVNALVNQAKAGKDVQVIVDSKSVATSHYLQFFNQLSAAGVKTYRSSNGFNISHSKSFLVDHKTLFISTMNLVGHFADMRDYGIFTTDATLISDFENIVAEDIKNSSSGAKETPALKSANIVVSPLNSKEKLIDLIHSATKTINLTVENLGDPDFINALIEAAHCGVKIQVLIPECVYMGNGLYNFDAIDKLQPAGVQIHVMGFPASPTLPYMHAKTIVIDDQLAFLGSENYTENSLLMSREIGVIFGNTETIRDLGNVFNTDWQRARPAPSQRPTCPSLNTQN